MKPALFIAAMAGLLLILAPFALKHLTVSAPPEDHIMTVDEAFAVSLERHQHTLQLNIDIAPGAYLYRDKLHIEPEGLALGQWQLPAGEPYEDEYFGKSQVYREQLALELPLLNGSSDGHLMLHYQGCGSGLCYPPQQRKLEVN